MYGYGIFFVCEITSGCRLEISTFGSQCSPSSTVANSSFRRVHLSNLYNICGIYDPLTRKKGISRAFL